MFAIARFNVIFVAISGSVNGMLVVMDWLNIMLIIEPVVKHVMILVLNSMIMLVLTCNFTSLIFIRVMVRMLVRSGIVVGVVMTVA